jgi:hypothetical protein
VISDARGLVCSKTEVERWLGQPIEQNQSAALQSMPTK